jgi:hypothetical protein
MNVLDFLERLARFTHENFSDEMILARGVYFKSLGVMHETDELYEETMKSFLDWFLLERPLDEIGKSPIRLFLDVAVDKIPSDDLEVFRDFAFSGRRSLFLIRKVRVDCVECRDLFSGERLNIREDAPSGFFKGEIFEGRILPFMGELRFGELLRFHPDRANPLIRKAARRIKDASSMEARDLMMRLAGCKTKHFRHPRIDSLQIYRDTLK